MSVVEEVELVCYTYNYDKLEISKYGNQLYERYDSITKLLTNAWNLYVKGKSNGKDTNKTIYKTIYLRDRYDGVGDYCFGVTNKLEVDECFPFSIYDKWEAAKVFHYEESFNEIIQEGNNPPLFNKAFWIGAMSHYSRFGIDTLTNKYPEIIDFRILDWNNPNNFVSLKEHCKYSILVDLRGWGGSGRLPLLLATGRPIILATRTCEQWFYHDGTFQPWVHYIPCGEKYGEVFSHDELVKSVKWAIDNPAEAAQIGKNGQEYAKNTLQGVLFLKK